MKVVRLFLFVDRVYDRKVAVLVCFQFKNWDGHWLSADCKRSEQRRTNRLFTGINL